MGRCLSNLLLCCYLVVTFSRSDPCWGQFEGLNLGGVGSSLSREPRARIISPNLMDAGVPAHASSPLATICTLPPTSTLISSPSLAACKYRSEGRPISYPCSTRTSTEPVPR
jgi:hypothetical protein